MTEARVILDRDFVIGQTDPRLFGGFIEHLGRHIYTGLYEPGHPTADEHGFRRDVIELVRELNMPVMRYPGGNFVSGYRWEDGVGPREQRPVRLDLAWRVTETNAFGTNEFITWCRAVGTQPMLAINLGTRGAEAACALLEYCNHPRGTYWSDLRRRHGYEVPHQVRLWCLGNEMDGNWQLGHKTPAEYGRLAAETARAMRAFDRELELVACGSSHGGMPTFGTWEWEVLSETYDLVDYVSIHSYLGKGSADTASYLAQPDGVDRFIEEVVALVDAVAARRRSRKRLALSFDEWNVWGTGKHCPERAWMTAPRSHETLYTVEDALCVGGILLALINHADRVRIACLAQVVNVLAPIMTEPGGRAWRQTIFYPLAMASRFGRGTVLRPVITSTLYDTPAAPGTPHLKMAAVRDTESRKLALFVLNRDVHEPLTLTVELRGFPAMRAVEAQVLADADLSAANTLEHPDRVRLRSAELPEVREARLVGRLPPVSWNVIRLEALSP